MYKYVVMWVLAIALAGCDGPAKIEDKDVSKEREPIKVTVFVYDTKKLMRKSAKDNNVETEGLLGYARWNEREPYWCEIHVVRLSTSGTMRTWGHELAHCIYGKFHTG